MLNGILKNKNVVVFAVLVAYIPEAGLRIEPDYSAVLQRRCNGT